MIANTEFMGQETEVVDVCFVRAGVTDGADKDEFGQWKGSIIIIIITIVSLIPISVVDFDFVILLHTVMQYSSESTKDQSVILFWSELSNV